MTKQSGQIEALKFRVAWLQQQVFGRKSEQSSDPETAPSDSDAADEKTDNVSRRDTDSTPKEKRNRGQQPGGKGHGRRRREELPTKEQFHDLSESEKLCRFCGLPYEIFPGTEDSEEYDWDVRVIRRRHRRHRYRKTCRCPNVPGIITAPVPPKLIPKGMFSTGFWTNLLLDKYHFQRPLYCFDIIMPVLFKASWYRLFGARIARGVLIVGRIIDAPLITMEKGAHTGADSFIFGHYVADGKIRIGRVWVGENVTIGLRVVIMPDVKIAANATIGACALVTSGKRIGTNETWVGIPARPMKSDLHHVLPEIDGCFVLPGEPSALSSAS